MPPPSTAQPRLQCVLAHYRATAGGCPPQRWCVGSVPRKAWGCGRPKQFALVCACASSPALSRTPLTLFCAPRQAAAAWTSARPRDYPADGCVRGEWAPVPARPVGQGSGWYLFDWTGVRGPVGIPRTSPLTFFRAPPRPAAARTPTRSRGHPANRCVRGVRVPVWTCWGGGLVGGERGRFCRAPLAFHPCTPLTFFRAPPRPAAARTPTKSRGHPANRCVRGAWVPVTARRVGRGRGENRSVSGPVSRSRGRPTYPTAYLLLCTAQAGGGAHPDLVAGPPHGQVCA